MAESLSIITDSYYFPKLYPLKAKALAKCVMPATSHRQL